MRSTCGGGSSAFVDRRVDVIGTKDVRSWFDGIAATHSASAGWALAPMSSSRPRSPPVPPVLRLADHGVQLSATAQVVASQTPEGTGSGRAWCLPGDFVERVGDDALAPLAAAGDFAHVDPDEPTAHGRIMAVRADGSGRATLARRLLVDDGSGRPTAASAAGDSANIVERSAAVILKAATHWPEVVVVDGNHEYYDTSDGGRALDAGYRVSGHEISRAECATGTLEHAGC